MPVLANAGASGAQGSDAALGFSVPRAAAFATRENLLGASLTMFKRVKAGRNEKVLARAEGQRLGHPSVNTDGGQGVERNIVFNRQRERDMPAVRGCLAQVGQFARLAGIADVASSCAHIDRKLWGATARASFGRPPILPPAAGGAALRTPNHSG